MDVKGTLGKFGYHDLPDAISDLVLKIATDTAHKSAIKHAPYDPVTDPIHIRDELKTYYSPSLKSGFVFVQLPYANAAEWGSRSRSPHPFMRPASKAAKNKMKSVIKSSTKKAVDKEKAKHGQH